MTLVIVPMFRFVSHMTWFFGLLDSASLTWIPHQGVLLEATAGGGEKVLYRIKEFEVHHIFFAFIHTACTFLPLIGKVYI